MKWLVRGVLGLVGLYLALVGAVALLMLQPPERFGQIMKHLPMPVIWALVPGPRIWMWAREGKLREGQPAPDFALSTPDGSNRVTLSSHRGQKPVVLIFGSYT